MEEILEKEKQELKLILENKENNMIDLKKRNEQLEEQNTMLKQWYEEANNKLKQAHSHNIDSIRARKSSILKEPHP